MNARSACCATSSRVIRTPVFGAKPKSTSATGGSRPRRRRPCHTAVVNRRLRLALFLAALAAAGPLPSARLVDAARADVSIAWFRGDRSSDFRKRARRRPVAAARG